MAPWTPSGSRCLDIDNQNTLHSAHCAHFYQTKPNQTTLHCTKRAALNCTKPTSKQTRHSACTASVEYHSSRNKDNSRHNTLASTTEQHSLHSFVMCFYFIALLTKVPHCLGQSESSIRVYLFIKFTCADFPSIAVRRL